MIEVDFQLTVSDRQRRFDLAPRFASQAHFVALYGPSGSGKTLTLQAMAGLQRPTRGVIRVNGRTLFSSDQGIDWPPPERRVGYLFQDYALFPHLTVWQNVAFGLTTWRQRRLDAVQQETVERLLAAFDLTNLAHSRPATLSGGQKQRVGLARALASEPEVLLLDEPFASLNPMLRQSLRTELAQVLARWQIPVVMITHDIDDVMALADVAFVYDQGQVVREVNLGNDTARQLARQELAPDEPLVAEGRRGKLLRLMLGD